MTPDPSVCRKCQEKFVIGPDDVGFYAKMGVPSPMLCPDCRMKRKLVWRNERALYNRSCDLCKEPMISMYTPKSPYVVYCLDCYVSDKWDPLEYGMEYNTSRSFFDQVKELFEKVPKQALYTTVGTSVNSPYQNFAGYNKNCYLVFNSGNSEDCMYSRGARFCRGSVDCYYVNQLEEGYECVNVQESYRVRYGQNAISCLDSWFLLNCSNCQSCFGGVNLRNKRYHFFGEQLSKEEYEKRVKGIVGSYVAIREQQKRFEEFALKFPRRQHNNLKSVGSEGEYIFESNNCKYCFEVSKCENCAFCHSTKSATDCRDSFGYGYDSELLLETVATGYSNRMIGTWGCHQAGECIYSLGLRSCKYCIGCDSVKEAEYCVLNKKYSKEEYLRVKERIVGELTEAGEYGLFFPQELALFSYNESLAQEEYPLKEQEAAREEFRWEEDTQMTRGGETMGIGEIPDRIEEVGESITEEILACRECGRNYRITPQELQFYRKMELPIPRNCFHCRHAMRVDRWGPFTLFARTCAKCGEDIKTTYAPDRPETVYCEECFRKEVF